MSYYEGMYKKDFSDQLRSHGVICPLEVKAWAKKHKLKIEVEEWYLEYLDDKMQKVS